jgi:hypothetical protein
LTNAGISLMDWDGRRLGRDELGFEVGGRLLLDKVTEAQLQHLEEVIEMGEGRRIGCAWAGPARLQKVERVALEVPEHMCEELAELHGWRAHTPVLVIGMAAELDDDVVVVCVVVAEEEEVVVAASLTARADELHLEELVEVVNRPLLLERVGNWHNACSASRVVVVVVVLNHLEFAYVGLKG